MYHASFTKDALEESMAICKNCQSEVVVKNGFVREKQQSARLTRYRMLHYQSINEKSPIPQVKERLRE
jgi:hypothetical protein